MGETAKLILDGVIKSRGVCAPTVKDIYEPILDELIDKHDCKFIEEEIS